MLSQSQRKEIKTKIQDLIIKGEEEVHQIELMTAPIGPTNAIGRVSRMDAIQNKSVMEAALRNKKEKLAKLKVALHKIEEANFGLCARCGGIINTARLVFMPESSQCISCATRN